MIKIKLVNKDWELRSTIKTWVVPRVGEYIYDRKNSEYLIVKLVIHDIIKGFISNDCEISLVVEET